MAGRECRQRFGCLCRWMFVRARREWRCSPGGGEPGAVPRKGSIHAAASTDAQTSGPVSREGLELSGDREWQAVHSRYRDLMGIRHKGKSVAVTRRGPMKAITYHVYGSPDVLRYEETEKPIARDNEVLIRVRAASVNPLDWHFMRGLPYPIRVMTGVGKPKLERLGVDVAGEVEAIGSGVTRFKPGDAVFGSCRAAFAEYACAPESSVIGKPDSATFEEAASAPVAAITALQGLRDKGKIRAGQKVLINGAAGGVETFAVQIARSFGADVTGVCSTRNVEMVRSIGADQVIDYTRQNFTENGQRYDIIFDCVGNHSLSAFRRVLKESGKFI